MRAYAFQSRLRSRLRSSLRSSLRRWPWVLPRVNQGLKGAVRVISREEIAVGGTSLIYRVNYSNGLREIEKILHPKFQGKPEYEQLLKREFEILDRLQHPLIVRPLRFRIEDKAFGTTGIVTFEHIEGVPLSDFSDFFLTLSDREKSEWANELLAQIASTLHHLSVNEVIHGDIAPENILIQPNGYIKLIDFGVSRCAEDPLLSFQVAGRTRYRAPELRGDGATSYKGDIYALGQIYEDILGENGAALQKNRLKIEHLCVERKLPKIRSTGKGWFEGLSPLPERSFFVKKGVVCPKTLLLPRVPILRFTNKAFKMACLLVSFGVFSSGPPQEAMISVKSWPYSSFSIDKLGRHIRFETPVSQLKIPAGALEVEFIIPAQKNRRVIRRVQVVPGAHVKLFEDFQNLDTLEK